MKKNNIFSALSERSFLLAWIGEVFALISTHVFNFFLILVVFEMTHSNIAASAVVLTITIPSIIFGVLAGAYVDRWDKKKVLIVVNILRAMFLVFLALYVDNLILIYVISFIFSFITQFFIPAELPIIPLIVSKRNMYSANALFGMAIYGSILVSYILAGPLIIYFKPAGTVLFLAGLLIVASLFIVFMKLKYSTSIYSEASFEDANIFEDMKYTLSLISRKKDVMLSILFLALSQTLILVVATIAPGYAASVLNIPIVDFPMLFVAPAALGTVAGAVILIHFCHDWPKNILITIGVFLSSLAMMALPFGSKVASKGFVQVINQYLPNFFEIDILHIVIAIAFVLGFANSLVFVPANTLLQEKTSEKFRGKVYGFLNTFIGVLSLLPVIVVGGLADIIGVGAVITGIGIFLFLIGLIRVVLR